MIIDFHIHLSRPEQEHPWGMDWLRSHYRPESGEKLEDSSERVPTA